MSTPNTGGFVYIMSTPSMPDQYKVGQTTNITKRTAQLSGSTAVPLPFTCDHKVFVKDQVQLEKAVHAKLDRYRVSSSKEFFGCHIKHIKNVIEVAHYELFGTFCDEDQAKQELQPAPEQLKIEESSKPTGPQPESSRINSIPRTPEVPPIQEPIEKTLQTWFGHSTFRPGQKAIIEQILAGKSSAAVFPTGSGKSLCYQLPALLLPGLTLVISPLLALMKDQIDALHRKGIRAARLDSTMNNNEYQETMRSVRAGEIKILYVAPERLLNERFRAAMKGIRVSLFAVDEAHCVSEWGHNFRPEYLKLPIYAKALGAERVLTLTATATKSVLRDICSSFGINPAHAVCTGFYRPNLNLLSMPIDTQKRDDELLADLRLRPRGPTIVYVTLQKTAEKVARMLSENGIDAKAYHAGMDNEDRVTAQDWFIQSKAGVIVATIAFGMGIDKADIRYVYHYNLPKSLENYSQEIGRAGRDGLPSTCKVYACPDDLNPLENFVHGDTPTFAAIQSLLDFIFSHQDNHFEISLIETGNSYDIRSIVLSTIMTNLELSGFIQAETPFHAEYQFKTLLPLDQILAPFSEERKVFLRQLFSCAKTSRVWATLDIDSTVQTIGTTRERVVTALTWLSEQQMIELKARTFMSPYRITSRPESLQQLAQNIHEAMLKREFADLQRLNQVLEWTVLEQCQTKALAAYFGEDMGRDCGHCAACLKENRKPITKRNPPPPHVLDRLLDNAADLRRQHPEMNLDPVSLTRFFCGISSPKLMRTKLGSKHELFGIRADTPFAMVLKNLKEGWTQTAGRDKAWNEGRNMPAEMPF